MRSTSSHHPLTIALHGLIVAAVLAFGNTCARGGLDCAACSSDGHRAASAAPERNVCGHAENNTCADPDGCDQQPTAPCARGTLCCSSWGAPPATVSLGSPAAAALGPVTTAASLEPGAVLAAGLTPIPAESPPPLIRFLRL